MNILNQSNFTILLVDDRMENLVSLKEMLTRENRDFLTATSGNQALKLVLKNENIGLIMLDVQMPEMDGFEVARILKSNARTKEIPIIFVTAINNNASYVLQGFEEGAVDYIQKPLDINVTKAKVNVFEQLFNYQQSLKASKLEVEKINKQLERFVDMVSHDLKSPLASIITMLSIIKRQPEVIEQPDVQENIDLVYIASTQLSEMINSILEYSKQSYAQQAMEEVDTGVLVSQVSMLLFPPPHIKVVPRANMPVLYTRKQKLQQVFQNLLSNSIKYLDKEQGLIEVAAEDKGRYCLFSVNDNGPVII